MTAWSAGRAARRARPAPAAPCRASTGRRTRSICCSWVGRRVSTRRWASAGSSAREEGQISLLILGFAVILMSLVVGGIAVTSAQLARVQLYDVADAAALDAADEIDTSAYAQGVGETVPIADATVREAADAYVGATSLPHGMTSWELLPGTGSPDGQTAVVRMRCAAKLPLVGGLVSSLGGSVTITVESRARAGLAAAP